MSLYLLNARDKSDSLDLRLANRGDHIVWLKSFADKIAMVGPVFLDDGETMAGSTMVFEADTLKAARAFADGDPYAKAGLFKSVEIVPFKWAMGAGKPSDG